jgi:hypothetical protein
MIYIVKVLMDTTLEQYLVTGESIEAVRKRETIGGCRSVRSVTPVDIDPTLTPAEVSAYLWRLQESL